MFMLWFLISCDAKASENKLKTPGNMKGMRNELLNLQTSHVKESK